MSGIYLLKKRMSGISYYIVVLMSVTFLVSGSSCKRNTLIFSDVSNSGNQQFKLSREVHDALEYITPKVNSTFW